MGGGGRVRVGIVQGCPSTNTSADVPKKPERKAHRGLVLQGCRDVLCFCNILLIYKNISCFLEDEKARIMSGSSEISLQSLQRPPRKKYENG